MSHHTKIRELRESPIAKNQRTHSSKYSNKGPTSLVEGIEPPEGYQYIWFPVKIMNEFNTGEYQRAIRLGLRPVPADRHPELALPIFNDPYNVCKTSNKEAIDRGQSTVIEVGGLCLMECPTDTYEEFENYCKDQTYLNEEQVRRSYTDKVEVPIGGSLVNRGKFA